MEVTLGIYLVIAGIAFPFLLVKQSNDAKLIFSLKKEIDLLKRTTDVNPASLTSQNIKSADTTTLDAKKEIDGVPVELSVKSTESSFRLHGYSKKDIRNISFYYINGKGEVSEREVAVNKLTGTTFTAYCLKRRATRTFSLSGICGAVTITSTGELISPQEWANAFEVISM